MSNDTQITKLTAEVEQLKKEVASVKAQTSSFISRLTAKPDAPKATPKGTFKITSKKEKK